jgi:diguanylate cyclase (GGDEF)-like protein
MVTDKPLNLKPDAPKPLNLKANAPLNAPIPKTAPWLVLIVDDDQEIHTVTRFILANVTFQNRSLELFSVYSAAQAREFLQTEKDIAVILLDVIMETDDAGLQLTRYIREELHNKAVRIILRTGQPGQAPEEKIIVDYDINDYKAKSELTAQKLFTTLIATLRSYDTIISLEKNRAGLEKIIESSDSLFQISSVREFASGILTQLSSFLDCKPEGIICIKSHSDSDSTGDEDSLLNMEVVAATGKYSDCLSGLNEDCSDKIMFDYVQKALRERKSQFCENYTVLYLEHFFHKATIALLHSGRAVDVNDRKLIAVFASKISIALANVIHYQKMISAEEAATTDFLTGLNNRRQLLRQGVTLLAVSKRNNTPVTLAMLDIDFFKRVNDTYGHDAGDLVLKQVGELLKKRFRASDVVARYGGEEFCILAPQLDEKQAFELFDSFRAALEANFVDIQGEKLAITVSIGVTTVLSDSIDTMISQADALLYQAKQNGRNRVVIL